MKEKLIQKILSIPPKEQEALFHTIIDRTLSGLVIFQEQKIVFANPALQELLGMPATELLGRSPFDFVHWEDREMVKERASRRLAGSQEPDDYPIRIVTRYGQTRWVRVLATPIAYRGEPAVLGAVIDIDERKRLEDLRTQLLDSLPHPAMLLTRDRIILAANRYAQDLGVRVGDYCGGVFESLSFSHEQYPTAREQFGQDSHPVAKTKCNYCKADEALDRKEQIKLSNLEGLGKLWDAFWIPVDEETYLHYAIDVTEQRKIEQEIRENEHRYRLIADTMSDGLSVQNPEGVIRQVNHRLCEITGFTRDELIGRSLVDLFVKEDDRRSVIAAVLSDQERLEAETVIHHKEGRTVAVSVKIDLLVDKKGNAKGSFAFFNDISELKMLRQQALDSDEFEHIVGREPSMRSLFRDIVELGACDFPVLIQGESGVGKELVARAVHNQSHRAAAKFVPINCAALPESLIESELFGHVKGAFTGAIQDKKGRFELAHGGTIFLDEITELSPAVQVKLLRILQEGTFERVGDHQTIKANVRIISASNKNIEHEVRAGNFRSDLYYRLCVMPVLVPPLRERKNDIPLLIDHFISAIAGPDSSRKSALAPETQVLLMNYDWPGNVRELQNTIQYASVKSKGDVIQPSHLPANIRAASNKISRRRKRQPKLDQESVQDALRRTGGNKLEAAKFLGVNRSTLYRFLDQANNE